MRCNECGYMNEASTKVCAKCGTKLSAAAATPPNESPASPPKSEGAPTMRGKAASAPAWDEPGQQTSKKGPGAAPSGGVNSCASCGFYPLKEAPAQGSPCPNCGFEGENVSQQAGGDQVSAAQPPSDAKTMRLGEMNIGEKSPVVKLKDEGSGRTIEFSGNAIDLNRQNLEPSNASLSGKTHAVLKMEDGQCVLEDKSSNGATFVQVDQPVTLTNGSKIILGNKVYTVEF